MGVALQERGKPQQSEVDLLRIVSSERLQVRERVRRSLPLFIIQRTGRNREIAKMWRLPGTSVRVSPQGDIFYPVWRERSYGIRPELYFPLSKLPWGWTFARLLASKRRPISEVIFHQVKKDGGTVEAAIRNMDHVLERYRDKGKELEQVGVVREQIDKVISVLQETRGIPKEDFEKIFENLYQQTLELMEKSGMRRARSALKRDIDLLLKEASGGKDRAGRRNPGAMMKKLDAAVKRVEYRFNEVGFIVGKFGAMRMGLIEQRMKDRGIFQRTKDELKVALMHEVFKSPEKGTDQRQKGTIMGKTGTLIYRLGLTRVKGYRPIAVVAAKKLEGAIEMVRTENYQEAKQVFQEVLDEVSSGLDKFQEK